MVTADIEGLHTEMERRNIQYDALVSKGELIKGELDDMSTTESKEEVATATRG